MRPTNGDYWAPRNEWGGEFEDEFEDELEGEARKGSGTAPITTLRMRPQGPPQPAPVVKARILWPALGFPAVIAPRSQPPTGGDEASGNATRCICVLVLSDSPRLSKVTAARYLRYVPWTQRGRRHIPADAPGAFADVDLEVRSHAIRPMKTTGPKDLHGELVAFGGDRGERNGIVASLTDHVRKFYERAGLRHLYEIRVSEHASARLADGKYHLFWNNASKVEDAPSDEMALLLSQYAAPRRQQESPADWRNHKEFLLREYEFEYGYLHQPYQGTRVRTEVLHPLFVERQTPPTLRIGHATDLHVSVRNDVYEHNLQQSPAYRGLRFNNWNRSAAAVYERARSNSDIVLLTGDLIDYGRGHWGVNRADRLGDDASYQADRDWLLFHYLLVANGAYTRPVYTILGNHDWRLNPYTPFAVAGAPAPSEFFHGMPPSRNDQELEEQRKPLRAAHGEGWRRIISYVSTIEKKWQLLLSKTAVWQAVKATFGNSQTADLPGYPTETTVKSIEWYLLAINPFLDYWFARPQGQQVLMLDWAEDENVFFEETVQGKQYGINVPWLFAGNPGADGPKARNCLTDLQWWLVSQFTEAPGTAKVIGIHAPPIGPWSDWSDQELFAREKKYPKGRPPRGNTRFVAVTADGDERRMHAHPLYAIRPKQKKYSDPVFGMDASYMSFERKRDDFIRRVANPRHGVRAVLAGHIHRNGLFSVYVGDRSKGTALAGQWLVQAEGPPSVMGVKPPLVSRRPAQVVQKRPSFPSGPLYVTTTSGGPRGNVLPETGKSGRIDPGLARVHVARDGTIEQVAFESVPVSVAMQGGPPRMAASPGVPARPAVPTRPVVRPPQPSPPTRVPVGTP
jgi:hypothetical protein